MFRLRGPQVAAGRGIETADHIEQGALAAAGRTDKADEGTGFDAKGGFLDRLDHHITSLVRLAQAARLDQCHAIESFMFQLVIAANYRAETIPGQSIILI